jgi:DNA-binding HxlR family transcriptional regulator
MNKKINQKDNLKEKTIEKCYYNEDLILEIKNIVKKTYDEIKKISQMTNDEYGYLINLNLKNNFIKSINAYLLEKIILQLKDELVNNCDLKNNCEKKFKEFLKKNTEINPKTISKDSIKRTKSDIKNFKNKLKRDNCDICIDTVSKIFENHIELIKSLELYNKYNKDTEENKKQKETMEDLNEKELVKNILTPIAHEKRLEILKAISNKPQSFSKLSHITKLKGGNLIFHINKLQENKIIFQKQPHGKYLLSPKGFQIIQLLKNMPQ